MGAASSTRGVLFATARATVYHILRNGSWSYNVSRRRQRGTLVRCICKLYDQWWVSRSIVAKGETRLHFALFFNVSLTPQFHSIVEWVAVVLAQQARHLSQGLWVDSTAIPWACIFVGLCSGMFQNLQFGLLLFLGFGWIPQRSSGHVLE